jgi:hypothetical protein
MSCPMPNIKWHPKWGSSHSYNTVELVLMSISVCNILLRFRDYGICNICMHHYPYAICMNHYKLFCHVIIL